MERHVPGPDGEVEDARGSQEMDIDKSETGPHQLMRFDQVHHLVVSGEAGPRELVEVTEHARPIR